MKANRTTAIVALCLALAAPLALAGPASARLVHERQGSFAVGIFSSLAVDNSGGPNAGAIWVAEPGVDPAGFPFNFFAPGRVHQLDASGNPTGIEFDGSETPAGSFGFASSPSVLAARIADGVAVDGSEGANAGRIYIADLENGAVDLFDEAGEYVCQITGEATASPSECAGAAGSETPTGGIEPLSVAVNPANGDVAVGDASGVVYLFNEAGEFLRELSDPHITEPGSLAFDSTGALYAGNSNGNNLFFADGEAVKFDPSGSFEGTLSGDARTVGVDTGSDHVLIGSSTADHPTIREFDAAGGAVSSFGEGATSVDANATDARIYAIDGEEGQIWSGPIFVPDVFTGEATDVGEQGATLHGEVDPEVSKGGSDITSCEFEFGTTEAYGRRAPCSPATPYSSPTAASAAVTGLEPGTTYHFRLIAENEEGQSERGEDRTFITLGPPRISGELSIARTHGATVKAQIDPFGFGTTCRVQYVDRSSFEAHAYAGAASVPCEQAVPAGFGLQPVSARLVGLAIGTVYHYRFIATSAAATNGGTTFGEDQEFSTFGIESFSVELIDEEGNPYLDKATGLPYIPAGGHPYEMRVRFKLATTNPLTDTWPSSAIANLRTVKVQLPPGLIGNPTATEACPPYQVQPLNCSPVTQIGTAMATPARTGVPEKGEIYNVVPPSGVAAQLSGRFNSAGIVRINAGVRSGSDYGVNADTLSVTVADSVTSFEMTLWGVPGDHSHDSERKCPPGVVSCSGGQPVPFLTNPTACTGPLTAGLSVDSWQAPGEFVSRQATMPPVEGCERLRFDPTIEVQPTVSASDSPSGLHVDLHVPQNENPDGLATANLKDAVVTLPAGVAVNPSSANGLAACSVAQMGYKRGTAHPAEFTPEPARCPDAAKIGTVEVDTPLLDHPLKGAVYVAEPHSNPFDSLLAIYIAVDDPESGVVVKLAGKVEADPRTGQLKTTFDDNPQLPFEDFELDFFGGPRAALVTPQTCGSFRTETALRPWSENGDAHPSDSFAVGSGPNGSACARSVAEAPNSPSFSAGTLNPLAGAYSPFVLHLSRGDGSQRIERIDTVLPRGLVARLADAPYCPDGALAAAAGRSGGAELAGPSCPPASQVGTVTVGAGAGPQPFHVQGKAYLAGPYRGAPLSLAIVTPAVAGPYDLGTVVVRTALHVDEETAQVSAKSDPLPTILEGIPLDIRSVALRLDRPGGFTLNPTSCEAMELTGTATSASGQAAALHDRFQVGGCGDLDFKPQLKLRLTGATRRSGHPALKAVVTYPAYAGGKRCDALGRRAKRLQRKAQRERRRARRLEAGGAAERRARKHARGLARRARDLRRRAKRCPLAAPPREANIARAQVGLPHSEFLDQGNLDKVCKQADLRAGTCPKSSIYGRAKAWTPLLDKPLQGPVYLGVGFGYKLPALVADLNGQIRILLVGRVDTTRQDGIRSTFEVVPDAPVSRFVLEMKGGRKYGLLENSEDICRGTQRASALFDAHNGLRLHTRPKIQNGCKRRKRGKRQRAHARGPAPRRGG